MNLERLAQEIDGDPEEPLVQMLCRMDNETIPEPEMEVDYILRALRKVSPELDALCKRAARHEAAKRIKLEENRYD